MRIRTIITAMAICFAAFAEDKDKAKATNPKLSDTDARAYREAQLAVSEAKNSVSSAAVAYLEAQRNLDKAVANLSGLTAKLVNDSKCGPGCQLDDRTLQLVKPTPPAAPSASQ